ncbi:hypothetical protein ACFSVM_21730 [Paenibacillus shunpengii]|uniref:Uncharacterized protein n=1 Tax=Paenibacillus shunpengii TaxID=2054424 RepID=A0ABW5SVY4_9BACL
MDYIGPGDEVRIESVAAEMEGVLDVMLRIWVGSLRALRGRIGFRSLLPSDFLILL